MEQVVPSYALYDPICDEHLCPITKEVLLDPYQSSCCGQQFSKHAVDKLVAQNACCPMCRALSFRCMQDKAFKRRVHQQLKVRCLSHKDCNWSGTYSDFLQHCGIRVNDTQEESGTPIVSKNVVEFQMDNFSSLLTKGRYYASQPFYTHRKGYKLCVRIFPYGFDDCEGTHLCAVVFLMNGEHDAQLKFPFRGSVTLQILNQKLDGEDQNYERIFEFNDTTHDTICRRVPESKEMNSGLAIYNFIPLNELKSTRDKYQYLKENSVKFKVSKIIVRSCSMEQVQSKDIISSTAQDLTYLPKSKSTETDVSTSPEQHLEIKSDVDASTNLQSVTNRQHSRNSSSSVESYGSNLANSTSTTVSEQHNESSQNENDSWMYYPSQKKRNFFKGSKDGKSKNSNSRRHSTRKSSEATVEADGDSSVFGSNDNDTNDTDCSDPVEDMTDIQETEEKQAGTTQRSFLKPGRRRVNSDGAVLCSQIRKKPNRSHSANDAQQIQTDYTDNTDNCSDKEWKGRTENLPKKGSKFLSYTLVGTILTIIVASLVITLSEKWQTPLLKDPHMTPWTLTIGAVPPTLALSTSNASNDSSLVAMELNMKNVANFVACKVSTKWRLIGVQLELPGYILDSIQSQVAREPESNMHAFLLMLEKWKTLQTSPYTWLTIIKALESPAVGENEVAAELRKKGIT